MQEIDVALSDVLVGMLALWLGSRVARHCRSKSLHGALHIVFYAAAAGAWLGAIWHGFYASDQGALSVALWRLTMLSVGVTAYGFALFGTGLLVSKQQAWLWLFRAVLLIYALSLLVSDDFRLAIAIYIPAVLLALAGLVRRGNPAGAAGLVLVLLASAYQQWGPDLHADWLTHNTVYHLILLPSLMLFWLGASSERQ
ncbi:MAG TPA: hypothetical protein VKA31_05710 [Mariprofundaceae bacterium]|nr:hypothetical protein [Mariprofundaceae bacterium]